MAPNNSAGDGAATPQAIFDKLDTATHETLGKIKQLQDDLNRLGPMVAELMDKVLTPAGRLAFYKSYGAAQFTILPPKPTPDYKHIAKQGAILLEMAKGNGDRNNPAWDWNAKVNFAISVDDIFKILQTPDDVDIFHKHDDNPKKLKVQPGQRNGYMLSLSKGKGDTRSTITCPLTEAEWHGVLRLLATQLPNLISW